MQYNQQAPWPHHSASLSVTSNGRAPSSRPRHATLPGPSMLPQPPLPGSSDHLRHIPASLTPGGRPSAPTGGIPQTSFSFNTTSALLTSSQPTSFYGDYFFTRPHPTPLPPPPVPQKPMGMTACSPPPPRPPIPPKPSLITPVSSQRNLLYPQSIPGFVAGPSCQPTQACEESSAEDKDIALALAMSESEARQREEDILAQEEADLMKALEESRNFESSYSKCVDDSLLNEPQGFWDGPSSSSSSPPSASVSSSPGKSFLTPTATTTHRTSRHPPEGESFLHLITPTTSQHYLDGDDSIPQSSIEPQESPQPATDDLPIQDRPIPTPPPYADAVSTVKSSDDTVNSGTPLTSPYPPAEFSRASDHLRRSPASHPVSLYPMPSPQQNAPDLPIQPPRRPSIANSVSSSSSCRSSSSESASLLSSIARTSNQSVLTSPPISFSSSFKVDQLDSVGEDLQEDEGGGDGGDGDGDDDGDGDGDGGADPNARPGLALTANEYVEPEMLLGVSMGFSRPAISTILSPMATTMPNLITLPYGKNPIFHFQAPTWRHLLKLMARLSGTRVEPTVEAITVAKHELKLRTVIQFVKIHHSASEWRTLLYFTIDMPVPPSVSNSHKYTNGDVNTLPYSYSLSPLPQLLRDGADSPMAKYYVVPSTNSTPYPTLPINFPNLAMYLQSAVEVSRKAANDSSGGVRKLAQNIDSCYPRDSERPDSVDFSETSRSRVGGMFKRVIKRGKNPRGRGGNEEIYDLVTPFVSEEWG